MTLLDSIRSIFCKKEIAKTESIRISSTSPSLLITSQEIINCMPELVCILDVECKVHEANNTFRTFVNFDCTTSTKGIAIGNGSKFTDYLTDNSKEEFEDVFSHLSDCHHNLAHERVNINYKSQYVSGRDVSNFEWILRSNGNKRSFLLIGR
jgi:hypothetical protein